MIDFVCQNAKCGKPIEGIERISTDPDTGQTVVVCPHCESKNYAVEDLSIAGGPARFRFASKPDDGGTGGGTGDGGG
jgi:DNA-directed RNA polymerase subunit RPC12/RpoP